ncbi:major facilitator superfamily domain-containing protein [Dactylonectria macrodidyma]|uniref:Major facilitator superfamily domain-containing protein n=1 Tax=Dactylonectria macrodidyma TaxID=307937 RepID=A0A9P9JH85_9HYPO|nr:major facilitator superfamily domain-containing protein [Dactylonectria macrodidyma]
MPAAGPDAGAENSPVENSPLLGNRLDRDVANGDAENGQGDEHDTERPARVKNMHFIFPAVGLGIYMVAIDQLLTVATYTKIGNELNALNSTSWIATAYFLTLTSCQPLYGKLSDIFGRKACLLFAYSVFALGCLGCGVARSIDELCAARAVAGVGGGGMNSVVSILLSDLVPLRERGVWQGYINILWAAGTSTGAPLGGLLADSIGWRWSFLGQVPLCFVAFTAVYFVLDLPPVSHDHWLVKMRQIDFLGAFTLVIAVVALLVGLDSGSNLGWTHVITLISLSLAPALFALFVFVEVSVASNPFAPGHIIFDRSLFACYLANFFGVAGQMAIIFFMPLFFQAVHGNSATQSGALLVPGMIAGVLASLFGGWWIKRTGRFYWVIVTGYGVLLLSVLPLTLSVIFRFTPGEVFGLVVTSLGAGCGITATLIGLLANASVEDTAVVIACSYLFRSLGSSVGISTGSAVLQQVLRIQLRTRLSSGDEARDIEDKVRQSLDYIKELPPHIANQVRSSYQVATLGAFALILVYLTASFLVTFWVKERILKR